MYYYAQVQHNETYNTRKLKILKYTIIKSVPDRLSNVHSRRQRIFDIILWTNTYIFIVHDREMAITLQHYYYVLSTTLSWYKIFLIKIKCRLSIICNKWAESRTCSTGNCSNDRLWSTSSLLLSFSVSERLWASARLSTAIARKTFSKISASHQSKKCTHGYKFSYMLVNYTCPVYFCERYTLLFITTTQYKLHALYYHHHPLLLLLVLLLLLPAVLLLLF